MNSKRLEPVGSRDELGDVHGKSTPVAAVPAGRAVGMEIAHDRLPSELPERGPPSGF